MLHSDDINSLDVCLFRRGTVAEWLECSPLVLKVSNFLIITISVHPVVNIYLTVFRAEEGEGSEEEEWHPGHLNYIVTDRKWFSDNYFWHKHRPRDSLTYTSVLKLVCLMALQTT